MRLCASERPGRKFSMILPNSDGHSRVAFRWGWLAAACLALALGAASASAAEAENGKPHHTGGEASLVLPDLNQARFLNDRIGGRDLLFTGLIVSAIGLAFGLAVGHQLKQMPVHSSMSEVSELIYETCKTYLITQGKFLFVLWLFIGSVIIFYFKYLQSFENIKVAIILLFSVIGILGS